MILASEKPYEMFNDLQKFPWLLKLRTYMDVDYVVSRVLKDLLAEVESADLAIANSSSRRPRTDRRDPVRHRGWPREADNVATYMGRPTPRQGPSGRGQFAIQHSPFQIVPRA